MKQSVIANGGGESNGGAFSLAGTTGQVMVGSTSGSPYQVRNGFWLGNLGPTASFVSVSGRVTTANGNGIRNASLSLVDSNGTVHRRLTASFGYYRFDYIEVGQNVVITIAAKRYTFAVATRIIAVQDELADVDFIAEP
ncbi:MAG: carboxypeptidase regulatory-like domain-containing protein [Blastocatellia bacterium]|nr:carboxypeptidase regulatory-like domain-containing protein [Blastocatellia bacterium]